MSKFNLIFLMVFLSSCANISKGDWSLFSKNETTETKQEKKEVKNYRLYEVLRTDTIASIARKYKVTASEIIMLNRVPKPYYLEPGSLIKIPKNHDDMRYDEDSSSDNGNTSTVNIGPAKPVKESPKDSDDEQKSSDDNENISKDDRDFKKTSEIQKEASKLESPDKPVSKSVTDSGNIEQNQISGEAKTSSEEENKTSQIVND
ncbi:MAG: LysM peptidoglycan-binding domain-containing protein [Rickettsiales bacterium]